MFIHHPIEIWQPSGGARRAQQTLLVVALLNLHLYCGTRHSYGEDVTLASEGNVLSPAGSSATILIVDDNEIVTRALVGLMKNAGFVGIGCHCGADALNCVETMTPAAAVIDVHLPDISGLILAQKLRDRFGPALPIIVVSGDTSMETLNSLSHVGATYFFSKPLSSASLVKHLKALLAGEKPVQQ